MINIRKRLTLPGTSPQPPAADEQVYEPQPAAAQPPAAQAAETTRRRRKAAPRDDWWNRLIAEGFLWLISALVWAADGFFTVVAIASLIPWWFVGVPVGAAIHYGVSRCQFALWHRWREPEYLIPLIACSLFNIGTTLLGLVGLAVLVKPGWLGGAPHDVWAWRTLVTATKIPTWTDNALVFAVLAIAMAVGAEPLLRRYWRTVQQTWNEKHARG